MNTLVVLALLLGAVYSAPVQDQFVDVTEDTLGNYNVQYKTHEATKREHRSDDGTVSGSYSYVDPDGALQTVEYTAGVDGFKPVGASIPFTSVDLPVPVTDTPEVKRARSHHLAAVERIKVLPRFREIPYREEVLFAPAEYIIVFPQALHPQIPLIVTSNTPEITGATVNQLDTYRYSLGHK